MLYYIDKSTKPIGSYENQPELMTNLLDTKVIMFGMKETGKVSMYDIYICPTIGTYIPQSPGEYNQCHIYCLPLPYMSYIYKL
jgi:hypothetical protein